MFTTKRRFGHRKVIVGSILGIVGLIGAACTPPPPPPPPSDDTVIRASQQPGGTANYTNVAIPADNESYLVLSSSHLELRLPNVANGFEGRDDWKLRCDPPFIWIGPSSFACPASGFYRQLSGVAPDLFGGPSLVHAYATVGTLVFLPGAPANRVTYTGTTEYYGSSRATIFGGSTEFVDGARVGQTWTEDLEVEQGDGRGFLSLDHDYLLFDRTADGGSIHALSGLSPLGAPGLLFWGEVEIGPSVVSAGAQHGGDPANPLGFAVAELACDGPQTPNPDGSASCSASGRDARLDQFGSSPPGATDHYDAAGTLTISPGGGGVPATAIFVGAITYVRTRLADGTDWVNPELAGSVQPWILQIQDGRPSDAPYPFPD